MIKRILAHLLFDVFSRVEQSDHGFAIFRGNLQITSWHATPEKAWDESWDAMSEETWDELREEMNW